MQERRTITQEPDGTPQAGDEALAGRYRVIFAILANRGAERGKLSTPRLQLGTRRWQPDLSACDLVGTPITPGGLRYRDVEIVALRTLRLRRSLM
jgi:hypothetical protein